jgi:hypothetical protein
MDVNMEWKKWLYGRQSQLCEEDTDWKRWLLGKPYRPFDPHVYLEFRLYKEFSAGIFDRRLSHASDLVHLWTDEAYPENVVANGGSLSGRMAGNPTSGLPLPSIPGDFSTRTRASSATVIVAFREMNGRTGTIENYGGEGASLFMVTSEGGRQEFDPTASGPTQRSCKLRAPPGAQLARPRRRRESSDELAQGDADTL